MKLYFSLVLAFAANIILSQTIPLPEHPRPDFERELWLNLNGPWDFEYDSLNIGIQKKWFQGDPVYKNKINVPFPWGSKLSGVKDQADIAWYRRSIAVPANWNGKRVFITIGASDWETSVWIDGKYLGKHQGGYMPFSFEITQYIEAGKNQRIDVRVDDKRRSFTLYGKQGYGNARGIWQTVYLEARGENYIDLIQCTPDIEHQKVKIKVQLGESAWQELPVSIKINTEKGSLTKAVNTTPGENIVIAELDVPNPHLWSLEDPYLYNISVRCGDDVVKSYFGMRKISVVSLPGTSIPYVAINDKPIYQQLTLDQSYHPEGFYTFPTDSFMKMEVAKAKAIGLNGLRIHIKPEIPRKLYWADKLGLLVMADLPNSWGEPDLQAQNESENTLKDMIRRDYNHPSIFTWVVFNETWGLITHTMKNGRREGDYTPETQNWVASMYLLTKSLDPTRIVDENSVCCGRGHTMTDVISWHEYLPGYEWEKKLNEITIWLKSNPGYLFEKGWQAKTGTPTINAECGNVWGYDGSTGDCDWSYDYHRMLNTFRKTPEISGWLYTEHHDVINEWNGYWRFDRTNKYTGFEEIVPGMTLNDLHSKIMIHTGNQITRNVKGGSIQAVPIFISIYDTLTSAKMTMTLEYELLFTDGTGNTSTIEKNTKSITASSWMQKQLDSLTIKMPNDQGLATLRLVLKAGNEVLNHNFFHFNISSDHIAQKTIIQSVKPASFSSQQWSLGQWNVLNGLKVNGAGKGFFEYKIPLYANIKSGDVRNAYIVMEVSSKPFLDKDKTNGSMGNQDYMLGSVVSPHRNPNAYPMTDDYKNPSNVFFWINDKIVKQQKLEDDPADSRGVLSWNSQPNNRKLSEAGTYGYLVKLPLTKEMIDESKTKGALTLKLECSDGGGIAIYGSEFGRYPIDINVVYELK